MTTGSKYDRLQKLFELALVNIFTRLYMGGGFWEALFFTHLKTILIKKKVGPIRDNDLNCDVNI